MDRLLTIADVYQPPTAREVSANYAANIQNRLAQMQMVEYEKKLAKEAQRNELAKKYFTAGSPQIGTPGAAQVGMPAQPAETVWGTPQMSSNQMSTLGMSPTGPYPMGGGEPNLMATRYSPAQAASPDYAPAVAPSADYRAAVPAVSDIAGYQGALYGAGDIEGGMAVQSQMEARQKALADKDQATANLLKTYSEVNAKQQEQILKKIELVGNMSAGVMAEYQGLLDQGAPEPAARAQAQRSYAQGVKYLSDNQINVGSMPPQFDPVTTAQAANTMLSIKDRLAGETAGRAERKMGLEGERLAQGERRIAESERHNRAMEAVSDARLAKTLSDRPLNPKTIADFNELQTQVERLQSLSDSFKPSYGGNTILGGWANTANELVGSNLDKVNWWKDYKELDAVRRNAIFGASLTGNEKSSWDAITVKERSSPETVRQAVENRLRLLSTAFNRMKGSYESGKYDVSGFQDMPVPPSEGFKGGTAPSGASSGRPIPKF